jgi:GT2 family glycosyltransferase
MLARALDGLAQQTFRDFEVIVVDNASSDDSAEACHAHPDVKLVRAGQNLGFAAGNNLAARHAQGRWLALLNPDAFPQPDWLAALVVATRHHRGFTMFGSRLVLADDASILDGVGDVYHVSGLYWREAHGQTIARAASEPREIFAPCAAAALYRRDAFDGAGGFDEDFFCFGEDVDLGFRLRLAGARALYVPDAIVLHVSSGITGRRSAFSVYHGQRNLVWVFAKDMPSPLVWIYLPAHLLANLATILVSAARGQGLAAWRAKRDALRGLRRMLAKRRTVQATRRTDAWRLRDVMAKGWPRRDGVFSRPLPASPPLGGRQRETDGAS